MIIFIDFSTSLLFVRSFIILCDSTELLATLLLPGHYWGFVFFEEFSLHFRSVFPDDLIINFKRKFQNYKKFYC